MHRPSPTLRTVRPQPANWANIAPLQHPTSPSTPCSHSPRPWRSTKTSARSFPHLIPKFGWKKQDLHPTYTNACPPSSSGMQQRVRLMLAIGSDRPLLLLDEPTNNLDKEGVPILPRPHPPIRLRKDRRCGQQLHRRRICLLHRTTPF